MGTIVCQECNTTIGHVEVEKVTTFYGKCDHHECNEVVKKLQAEVD